MSLECVKQLNYNVNLRLHTQLSLRTFGAVPTAEPSAHCVREGRKQCGKALPAGLCKTLTLQLWVLKNYRLEM